MTDLPPPPGEPWTCESCGRHVPGRVGQCRCGALAPSPVLAFDEAAAPAAEEPALPQPSRAMWWWAAPGLVGLGLLAGLYLARPAAPPPASAGGVAPLEALQPEPEEVEIEEEEVIGESAITLTLEVPFAAPPDTAPLAATAPPRDRTVEDLVAAAINAVVTIDAGRSRGTGFFVARDLVITNAHVVGQEASVTLRLDDGTTTAARVERLSIETDLALLRTPAARPSGVVLPLGSAIGLRSGQEVIVIGSPLGLQSTVTRGIVSALRDASGVLLVQTDAAINPGNSGGPLLDRQGRVIGVATLKQGDAESLGFAVAIDHARALIDGRPLERIVGASPPTRPLSPPDGRTAPPSASTPSAAELQREEGARAFDEIAQAMSRRADQVDGYWARFKTSCNAVPSPQRGDREWMGIVDRAPMFTAAFPACGSWLADLTEMASNLREDDARAREAARRAAVLPGTIRDTLRKYRMNWGE
jgi:S1-C subfamily serine protease